MKKTLLVAVIFLLFACATVPKYNPKEFDTVNYEINVENAIDTADLLKDFEQNKILSNISAEDLSKLVQADLYFNQGDYVHASDGFNSLAIKYKDPYTIYKAIISLEHIITSAAQIHQLNELINLFISVSPNSNLTKLFNIPIALNSNNYLIAENNLDYLMKNNPDNGRAILLFLSSTVSKGFKIENKNNLMKFADYVVKTYKSYPEAHLLAVIGYAVLNSEIKLNEELNFIYKRYPNWNIPLYWVAGILLKNNNILAVKVLENRIKNQQRKIEPLLQNMYISALINFNQLDKANSYLLSQLNSPEVVYKNNVLLNLGIINTKMRNFKEAANYLIEIKLNDNNIQSLINLLIASIFDYSNDEINAIKYYNMANLSNPYLKRVISIMLLNDYMNLKKYDEVNSLLNKAALENNLNERDTILLKSAYYISMEQFELAYNLFHSSSLKYIKDKDFLLNYAFAAAMTKRSSQAIELYKKYIKIMPNDAIGYNGLAYVLIDQTHNYKLAKIYVKKALKIAPSNPNIKDTLGWLYYKEGNYSNASFYIKNAYDATRNPQIAKHLQAVYIAMHKPEVANKIIVVDKSIIQMNLKQQMLIKSLEIMMYIQYGLEIK